MFQKVCSRHEPLHANILFNGISLQYSDKVLHLGHLLSFDLNDRDNIIRATKDVNRKTNYMIYTFRYLEPFAMTFLFKMYCLSLYGCILWSLSSSSLRRLQVAMNKILRKIWNLPRMSHTSVVLSTAGISYVHNIILRRFYKFVSRCLSSEFPFVKTLISDSLCLAYSSIGSNYLYGHSHQKFFNVFDTEVANTIRLFQQQFGNYSPFESHILSISS